MRFQNRFLYYLAIAASIVLFQNCSAPFQFSSTMPVEATSSSNPILASQNNGQGYDGKIVIFHHYDDTKKHWCQSQEVPVSVIYKNTMNLWFIQHTLQNPCSLSNPEEIQGVVISADQKSLIYDNRSYELPKSYRVDPLANANTADKNIFDGLCLDTNNLCSLQAAMEQASILLWIKDTLIQLPISTYKISSAIKTTMTPIVSDHRIHLQGENVETTVLDGQNLTSHLLVSGEFGNLDISNISFVNGSNSAGLQGSAISAQGFYAKLNINNCNFNGNRNNPDVTSMLNGGELTIKNSIFQNNPTNTASIMVFGTSLTVENSSIFNNAGMGIVVSNRTYNVFIRNSSIVNNGSAGIYLYECMNCNIENTTIYQNKGGLVATTVSPNDDMSYAIKVKNATIVNNSTPTVGNLHLSFNRLTHQSNIFNSVIANTKDGNPNCTGPANQSIVSQSSFYSDASCIMSGSGNINQPDPLLGTLITIPGMTSILRPQTGSPLINSGDRATCLLRDQILAPRGMCDIGAVEAL